MHCRAWGLSLLPKELAGLFLMREQITSFINILIKLKRTLNFSLFLIGRSQFYLPLPGDLIFFLLL